MIEKRRVRTLAWVSFFSVIACLAGSAAIGRGSALVGQDAAAKAEPAAVSRGESLFLKYCALCHGDRGDGAGKFAYLMNPRPRNFLRDDFKLSTTQNLVPSDDDLLRTISRGMPGSAMPPWGHLPNADLKALVAHVRKLSVEGARARFEPQVRDGKMSFEERDRLVAERTSPGGPIVVPAEPVQDDVRWFRGRTLYLEGCASCHGADGHPRPEAVKFDADGYPVPPRSFAAGIFKGGMEGSGLYCRILKGMKGTPMPSYETAFTADEIWDLVHYVQSLARAGAQDRAQLRQGTLVAANTYGALPDGPDAAAWDQARPLYVGLTPLWWEDERIEGLVVQALHNEKELALRFAWLDPTRDDRAVRHDEFRDAVAVQFSLGSDPPFYMGSPGEHGGVNIWMWKADRQTNLDRGYQDVDAAFPQRAVDDYPYPAFGTEKAPTPELSASAPITQHHPLYLTAWGAGNLVADPLLKTPVECLTARGPGTLAGKPANVQIVSGKAVYDRGVWSVQMQRTMDLPHEHGAADERVFRRGDYIPVSFAIWNGANGDRDGRKSISIWQKLVID
ncbi:MAG: hypothetical protein BroJett003_09460 [Planctomycetota bacterium]|nr:MAG: hypothetical protein BroJett003_09460 [Planctomycetota bacterium]